MLIHALKVINENMLSPWRWQLLIKHLLPYLSDASSILDVGAGDGGLSNELMKNNHHIKVTGVDVFPQEKSFFPIIHYDGKVLPFPDNSFDTVMINDVLHHDMRPEQILKEARRVSKKYILIKDHHWTNKIDFSLLKWADYFGNISYGVKLPYNYLKLSQWRDLFHTNKLTIMKQSIFRYNFFDPCKHVIFLLQKDEDK